MHGSAVAKTVPLWSDLLVFWQSGRENRRLNMMLFICRRKTASLFSQGRSSRRRRRRLVAGDYYAITAY